MVKNLSKVIVGGIITGALMFSPFSERIKGAYAGTEITVSEYRDMIRPPVSIEPLEKFIVEREKQSLIVQKYLLKKEITPQEYFDKSGLGGKYTAVFKGNEIKVISVHTDRWPSIPGVKPIKTNSEEEWSEGTEQLIEYLKELKQQGYKGLSKIDFGPPCCETLKKSRLIGIDEFIREVYQLEEILKAERQKKR